MGRVRTPARDAGATPLGLKKQEEEEQYGRPAEISSQLSKRSQRGNRAGRKEKEECLCIAPPMLPFPASAFRSPDTSGSPGTQETRQEIIRPSGGISAWDTELSRDRQGKIWPQSEKNRHTSIFSLHTSVLTPPCTPKST